MAGAGRGTDGFAEPSAAAHKYVAGVIAACRLHQRPVVLDTQALIGYVEDRQPVAALISPLLEHHDLPIAISVVTLSEILVLPARGYDLELVATLRRSILDIPAMTVVSFDIDVAVETAVVRANTGLRLPDAVIVATARLLNASGLIGNDRRWRAKALGVPYHHLDDILALS